MTRRRSLLSALVSACACAAICLAALSAEANIQSNETFYEMVQDGRDVHITLQLIDGETAVFETT